MNYLEITQKYGTPLYLFDTLKLKDRINYLKSFFPKIELIYAVKANTFLIPYVTNLVSGLELCSYGEYEIAKESGVTPSKMIISGVYKDEESIESMFQADLPAKFTIESLSQWQLINKLSKKYHKPVNVLLRLTSGSQFGMSLDDIKEILRTNHNAYLTILGLQYFSKTQRHSLPILAKELAKINDIIISLETEFNLTFSEFEYGPGFPVFYFEGEEFNESEFLTGFASLITQIKTPKISLELGRSIAASCGDYLTQVVDLKTNHLGTYAIIDGGINHLVYYGGNMGMKTPKTTVIPKRDQTKTYTICGSLCTINDIIVKEFLSSELKIGDLLVFHNTGAYSPFEGISLFLSRDLPRVLLKNNHELILLRDSIKTSKLNSPNREVVFK